MPRTRATDVSLWEAVLPPEVLWLPEELAGVDALLDGPRVRPQALAREPT